MTAKSYSRGHKIEYVNGEWVYSDDRTTAEIERPCIKCKLMPTPEGYDPCLGFVKDAISACCGHGVEQGFAVGENGLVIRDWEIKNKL